MIPQMPAIPLEYYALKLNHLALGVLLVGALIGCYRTGRWTAKIQLVGAVCMATSVVIGYLRPLRPQPGTHQLELGAAWKAQVILASAGLMVFAIAYAFEQWRGRKT